MKWCDNTLIVPFVEWGLCLSEKDFKRQAKLIGAEEDRPYCLSGKAATTHTFEMENGDIKCIITLNPDLCGDDLYTYSLLAHEAVHVWQQVQHQMGERNPSYEFEAYSIQKITYDLLIAYSQAMKFKKNRKKRK